MSINLIDKIKHIAGKFVADAADVAMPDGETSVADAVAAVSDSIGGLQGGDRSFDHLTLETASDSDGDNGVQMYPEGAETAPVLTFYGKNGDEPVVLRNLEEPEREDDAANKGYVDTQLAALKEDILYEPITITGISVSPSVAMIGSSIENPTVSWSVSREPAAQTVGGVEVGTDAREYTVEGSFSGKSAGGSQSIYVSVTDERGTTATKSAAMHFHNAVYFSRSWGGGLPTDEELREMDYALQNSLGLALKCAADAGEYVLYAAPNRLGTPEFWANGFQGGFSLLGVLNHSNAAGYREEYDIYVSNADGLNGVTITVK